MIVIITTVLNHNEGLKAKYSHSESLKGAKDKAFIAQLHEND